MSWETFDFVLLRGFLPLILLGATLTRYNGFSFAYLLLLLICPLLRYNLSENTKKCVLIYLSLLVTLSTIFSLSIPIFHIPILAGKISLNNCSEIFTTVTHQIGIVNLKGVLYYRVFRLVLPDYTVLITGIVLLIYFRKRNLSKDCEQTEFPQSENNNTINCDPANMIESEINNSDSMVAGPSKRIRETIPAPRNERTSSLPESNPNHNTSRRPYEPHKFWRAWAMQSLFVFFNVVITGFAGIISPSILNAIYLFAFLGICTFWALGNKVITTNFAYMRIFLLMYSAIHLSLLYLVQVESMQSVLPNGQFSSRLLGLYYLFDTSCVKRGEFYFQPQRWIDYLSPCTIIYVYYLCATETRRWFETGRELVPRVRTYQEDTTLTSIKQLNAQEPELQHLIADKETLSCTSTSKAPAVTDYQSTTRVVPLVHINHADLYHHERTNIHSDNRSAVLLSPAILPSDQTARPLLLSLINTAIRNSFVFTFIAMMAWSVTYKSWMSFILLLSACILWMMPDSRKACLYMSPLIVFYATCLILIQYIYGFNLHELPNVTFTTSGTEVDLSEIGLQKWNIPTGPLAVMVSA